MSDNRATPATRRPSSDVEAALHVYRREATRLRAALEEIAKGEGRYSRDPLTHAENTIEDMKRLAVEALEGGSTPEIASEKPKQDLSKWCAATTEHCGAPVPVGKDYCDEHDPETGWGHRQSPPTERSHALTENDNG